MKSDTAEEWGAFSSWEIRNVQRLIAAPAAIPMSKNTVSIITLDWKMPWCPFCVTLGLLGWRRQARIQISTSLCYRKPYKSRYCAGYVLAGYPERNTWLTDTKIYVRMPGSFVTGGDSRLGAPRWPPSKAYLYKSTDKMHLCGKVKVMSSAERLSSTGFSRSGAVVQALGFP